MRISDLSSDVCSSDLVEESGLSAYSDPALEERFHYLTGLFNAFGKIPASNYPTAVDQMKSTVIKRLQVARDWKEQPEILDEEIVQPFFVLGSARAGTTFTQDRKSTRLNSSH